MIPLTLRADISGAEEDFVVRASLPSLKVEGDAEVVSEGNDVKIEHGETIVRIGNISADDLNGDVLLVQPRRGVVQRLVRSRSKHNTFLVTERCDQLCVMCSQPPKKTHVDMFRHFAAAAVLAPSNAVLGLSGGEPTLYKSELFAFLEAISELRPDLSFHVLSNAQHFDEQDLTFLRSTHARNILWGVPLYAADSATHDELVGKSGAFENLSRGLSVLCRAGAAVELRTVVMQQNIALFPDLARFIARQLPFISRWAIMQLENIGFARNRWNDLFFDHSRDFASIAQAIDIARVQGMTTQLYNFPLCTVPRSYRRFAPATISDWKRRYERACEDCIARQSCGGFFEWHPSDRSYERIGPV